MCCSNIFFLDSSCTWGEESCCWDRVTLDVSVESDLLLCICLRCFVLRGVNFWVVTEDIWYWLFSHQKEVDNIPAPRLLVSSNLAFLTLLISFYTAQMQLYVLWISQISNMTIFYLCCSQHHFSGLYTKCINAVLKVQWGSLNSFISF